MLTTRGKVGSAIVLVLLAILAFSLLSKRGSEAQRPDEREASVAASSAVQVPSMVAEVPPATPPTRGAPVLDGAANVNAMADGGASDPGSLHAACIVACINQRTAEQVAADRAAALEHNEQTRRCEKKCGRDAGCIRTCAGPLVLSTRACSQACRENYPLPPSPDGLESLP
jgi:hypothetical protein